MTLYIIEAIKVVFEPVPNIVGHPDFTSLWGLKEHLVRGLKKIMHVCMYVCVLVSSEDEEAPFPSTSLLRPHGRGS